MPERRGYIRPSPRKSEASQRAALEAVGCRQIYAANKGESWDDFVHALRRGNQVVVDGFDRLAPRRDGATERLNQIADKGCTLMDARSGVVVDPVAVALWNDACTFWLGEARVPSRAEAVRRGKLGGRQPATAFMSDVEAKEIWDNPDIPKAEALKLIGLKERTAYRRLGERGVPPGRPKTAPPKTPRPRQSKIYFCQAGGPDGPVKIGITVEVAGRLGSLKTGHHDELRLLALVNGTVKDEKALHRRFAEYRKRGEWFEFGPRLKKYVESLPKPRKR